MDGRKYAVKKTKKKSEKNIRDQETRKEEEKGEQSHVFQVSGQHNGEEEDKKHE